MWTDRETAAISRYVRQITRRARSQGQGQIVLDVGEICRKAPGDSPNRYSRCCDVLDSDVLTNEIGLRYHGHAGVRGTANAQYIFLIVAPQTTMRERLFRIGAPAFILGVALVAVLAFVLVT